MVERIAVVEAGLLAVCGIIAALLVAERVRIGAHGSIGALHLLLLNCLAAHGAFRYLRLYDPTDMARGWHFVARAGLALATISVTIIGAIEILNVPEHGLFAWQCAWLLVSLPVLVVERHFSTNSLRKLTAEGKTRSRVALYADPDRLKQVSQTLRAHSSEIDLVGAFQVSADTSSLVEIMRLGQWDLLDQIVIALAPDDPRLDQAMKCLSVLPVEVLLLPYSEPSSIRLRGSSLIAGQKAARLQAAPLDERQLLIKRTFDIVVSALGLLALAPVLTVIAIAVKLDSSGPVFFLQRRHGYNHRVFRVVKFRSMTVLEDGPSVQQAQRGDCRVTKVGGFLRRTSLDELPQLWNVLVGDMSLVGPRPHALAHNDHYAALWPEYANRHRVKPGITGLAQVMGYRGETQDPQLMRRRSVLDLVYIAKWSFALDLWILVKTVLIVCSKKNAF